MAKLKPALLELQMEFIDAMGGTAQCICCSHYRRLLTCDAFPDGIPEVIHDDRFDHRNPYPGDHGIRFRAKEEDAE